MSADDGRRGRRSRDVRPYDTSGARSAGVAAGLVAAVIVVGLVAMVLHDPGPIFAPRPWTDATVAGDELIVRWTPDDPCEEPTDTRIEFELAPDGPELTLLAAMEGVPDCGTDAAGAPLRSSFPLPAGYPTEEPPADGACDVAVHAIRPICGG